MLLNGCLGRRGIDLAISTCLGRQKKSNQKASAVIGADFFVCGLI